MLIASRIAAATLAAVAVVCAGLYFFEQRGPAVEPSNVLVALNPFGIGRDVADDSTQGAQSDSEDLAMLDFSLEKVQEVYYKPVDVSVLLRGEQHGLETYLKSQHVAGSIALPADSTTQSADAADGMLRLAFTQYGSKVGDDDLTYAAISGMLDSLGDPYTVFLDPRDMRSLTELISGGNFGGIGVYIGQDPKTKETIVIEPITGTPADRAGLKAGDLIVSVDGHPTKGLALDPVMNLIRGKADSIVHLVVQRSGQPLKTYAVVREQIHVPSVAYRMLDDHIGYVQLFDFGETSAQELDTALDALNAKGAKAYILDLRNNGGGLLGAAVDISSKFIEDGPIVSIIDRAGHIETHDANGDAISPRPLIVLVNQFSASASEITAGAIQDTHAGTLVGVKTFGKGVVQTIYDLPGASAIKITTARYVTPAGRDINKKGIQPNIIVPMDPSLVGIATRDVQLRAAVANIEKQLALGR
ncbi:MAG TPA: S41 family peptidase [Candidatus Eremiobacteraceae bacterium]|nr:S41 family peptidase [Candidatus Eremiobacteraceae bacterium]